MSKILLVTRPLSPPWDEASKNFAFNLACHVKNQAFTILTNKHNQPGNLPNTLTSWGIYSNNHLDWAQRLQLLNLYKRSDQFEILHFMLTPAKLNALFLRPLLKNKRLKSIQTVATLREDLFTPQEFKKILFADRIVTYSDYAKNKLQQMGFANVERIYPGIDLQYFSPQAKDLHFLQELGLKDTDFVVSYPGEYMRLGATDLLTDLIPALTQQIPQLKFVFACRIKNSADAAKKAQVQASLAAQNVADKVIFTDTISDMAKLYNASDVVLFPVTQMVGKFDVPLAVIESFACAKPTVVTNLPVLAEFSNQTNSVIIEPGAAPELLRAIVELFEQPQKRTALGQAARKYVAENFSIEVAAKKYSKLYEQFGK